MKANTKKRRNLGAVLLLALLLAVCGAACGQPGNTPAETTPAATSPTGTDLTPPEGELSARPVWSQDLFVRSGSIFFVEPNTQYLMRVDIGSRKSEVLFSRPLENAFFLAGEWLFVHDLQDGYLYQMDTNGENLTKLFAFPFEAGLLLGNKLYLLSRQAEANAVLYTYEPRRALWSMRMLEGTDHMPENGAAVFGEDALYYIEETNGREVVAARDLATGEKTVAYSALLPGGGQLHSLCWRDGVLYLADRGSGLFAVDENGATLLPAQGERILAVLTDGLLFGAADVSAETILFGNEEGQAVEFSSGKVLASGGARAIIRRSDAEGREKIAMVKYPEDEEQVAAFGALAVLKVAQQHGLAFFYDRDEYLLLNLSTGSDVYLDGKPVLPPETGEEAG